MSLTAAAWQQHMERHLDPKVGVSAIIRAVETEGIDAQLDGTFMPEGSVKDMLLYAFETACGSYDHEYVKLFLTWCVVLGRSAEADPRWHSTWLQSKGKLLPLAHGKVVGDTTLAQGWLDDAAPDCARMVLASREVAQGSTALKGSYYWGEPEQSDYLYAVQYALIAGDIAAARELLRVRRSFDRVKYYYDWFSAFVDWLPGAEKVSVSADERRAQFDEFFDEARNPNWDLHNDLQLGGVGGNRMHLRFRLAILRWLYIEQRPITGYWRDIIAQISR